MGQTAQDEASEALSQMDDSGSNDNILRPTRCQIAYVIPKTIEILEKEKCLNFLWKQGVQNPVFAAIGEGIIFLPAMNLDKHRLRRSYPAT